MDTNLDESRQLNPLLLDDEWTRLPKPGARLGGLSRSTLAELTVPCKANDFKPPVKSVVIKKRYAMRGIRLISVPSLRAHLESLATGPQQ